MSVDDDSRGETKVKQRAHLVLHMVSGDEDVHSSCQLLPDNIVQKEVNMCGKWDRLGLHILISFCSSEDLMLINSLNSNNIKIIKNSLFFRQIHRVRY